MTSLWIDRSPAPARAALEADLDVDVCVIGAGITGLSTALLCARDGARVAVLEAGRVGGGVTGHTTAKVTALHGTIYDELRSGHGAATARLYAEANTAGLERIAAWVDELGIDCALRRRAAYTYAADPAERDTIVREAAAAQEAGLAAELVEDTPLPYPVAAAVRLADQAELDARAYVLGLADALEACGGSVYEHTVARTLHERGGPAVGTRGGHRVRAGHVVVATLMPVFDRGLFFTRLTAKRSYAIAVRTAAPVPEGMFISAGSPTRSIRAVPHAGEELLIVGGEGHTTGEEPDTHRRYERLEAFARAELGATEVTHRWSAHDLQPADGLPYVGRYTPLSARVLTAAGFRKWGLTNGTMAAIILADRIAGRDSAWASRFDANRLTPRRSARGILAESLKDARHLIGDRLKGAEGSSLDDVAPGEGRLVRTEAGLAAAYREPSGRVHAVSPTCTHLGCRVTFNTAERSWDCPCHGSRFAPDGTVLQGPATEPLKPVV